MARAVSVPVTTTMDPPVPISWTNCIFSRLILLSSLSHFLPHGTSSSARIIQGLRHDVLRTCWHPSPISCCLEKSIYTRSGPCSSLSFLDVRGGAEQDENGEETQSTQQRKRRRKKPTKLLEVTLSTDKNYSENVVATADNSHTSSSSNNNNNNNNNTTDQEINVAVKRRRRRNGILSRKMNGSKKTVEAQTNAIKARDTKDGIMDNGSAIDLKMPNTGLSDVAEVWLTESAKKKRKKKRRGVIPSNEQCPDADGETFQNLVEVQYDKDTGGNGKVSNDPFVLAAIDEKCPPFSLKSETKDSLEDTTMSQDFLSSLVISIDIGKQQGLDKTLSSDECATIIDLKMTHPSLDRIDPDVGKAKESVDSGGNRTLSHDVLDIEEIKETSVEGVEKNQDYCELSSQSFHSNSTLDIQSEDILGITTRDLDLNDETFRYSTMKQGTVCRMIKSDNNDKSNKKASVAIEAPSLGEMNKTDTMSVTSSLTSCTTDGSIQDNEKNGIHFNNESSEDKININTSSISSLEFMKSTRLPRAFTDDSALKKTTVRTDTAEIGKNDDNRLVISIVTWNLAEVAPSEEDASFIKRFRRNASPPNSLSTGSDLVMIGAQECEDIKPRRSEGRRSRHLRRLGIKMLGQDYVPIAIHGLGGIQMALYCHRDVLSNVEMVKIADVTCGVGNVFHNKGAIGVYLKMKCRGSGSVEADTGRSSRILLVTGHLAAHVKSVNDRNEDFKRIMCELEAQAPARFIRLKRYSDGSLAPCDGSNLLTSSDHILFSGDLNYRLDLPREYVESFITDINKCRLRHPHDSLQLAEPDKREIDNLMNKLLRRDQLLHAIASGRAFPQFNEGKITFLPTFKFDKGTSTYDTSHKLRVPAWTDRIVFKSKNLRVIDYNSVQTAMHSDHRPVYGTFELGLSKTPKHFHR